MHGSLTVSTGAGQEERKSERETAPWRTRHTNAPRAEHGSADNHRPLVCRVLTARSRPAFREPGYQSAYMTTADKSRPRVVCLCGSTRFLDAFDAASIQQTLAGNIVLSIATTRMSDGDLFAGRSADERERLLEELATLHRAKIDLADEILVLNVNGYIGSSTRAEIEYAHRTGTPVTYLEPIHPTP